MKYYSYDFRVTSTLILIGAWLTQLLYIPAYSLFWLVPPKLALAAIAGVFLLFAWIVTFRQKYIRTAVRFTDHVDRGRVLYGIIEPAWAPRIFRVFRIMIPDAGGLFRQGDDIVLGTVKGERRCPISRFSAERIFSGGIFHNRLLLHFGSDTVVMEPLWIGAAADRPKSQAMLIMWGMGEVQDIAKLPK